MIALAACGNSSSNNPDAKVFKDGAGSGGATVMTVSCTGITPAQTVMTSNFAFTPASVSISVGQVVKFAPENIHNVVPGNTNGGSATSDPGLSCSGAGQVCCFMFTHAGTFGYHCGFHSGMNGTVTVM